VYGRGIPEGITSVTRLGIDPSRFVPPTTQSWYAHDAFNIPRDRKIVFYAGHMEERKGVHVIVKAAVDLVDRKGIRDAHFLILGNRNDEAVRFDPLYRGTAAEPYITFGGYRQDIAQILPCSYLATIASTGWDSFPRSSLEMAACGLPLVVSRLPGLDETVEDGVTGLTFDVGDHVGLADQIAGLLADSGRRDAMSRAARIRVTEGFTIDKQLDSLEATIRRTDEAVRSRAS
jgi:glycosyltransferase involved in cell wall biosynthesis